MTMFLGVLETQVFIIVKHVVVDILREKSGRRPIQTVPISLHIKFEPPRYWGIVWHGISFCSKKCFSAEQSWLRFWKVMNMNACDEKLKQALFEVWKKENALLEEDMKQCEDHVFSEEFERKMKELLTIKKEKTTPCGFRRKFTITLSVVALL